MLQTLLAYARGVGVDTKWVVVEGNPDFFAITKRIHNDLYGTPGDGGALGSDERARLRGDAAPQRRGAARAGPPRRLRPAARSRRPPALAPELASGGRHRRVAMPRRHRPPQRARRPGLGLPAAVPRGRLGLRVLVRAVRAGMDRPRPARGDPAVDRPVLGQERAHGLGRGHPHPPVRRAARRRRRAAGRVRSPAATARPDA